MNLGVLFCLLIGLTGVVHAGGGGSGPDFPCDWRRGAKLGECQSLNSFSEKGEKDKIEFFHYEVFQSPNMDLCDKTGQHHVLAFLKVYVERDQWSWDMYTDPVGKGRSGLPVMVEQEAFPPNTMRKFMIRSFGVTNAQGTSAQLKADAYTEKSGWPNRGQYNLAGRLDRAYECRWAQ